MSSYQPTRRDKIFAIVTFIIILALIGGVIGALWYANTPTWTDTGNVSWIGPKSFGDNQQWTFNYAITTLNHGTLNFTYPTQGLNTPPSIGLLIGVVYYHTGNYRLVVDP